jgi:class 3 adenylate cyclase
MPTVGPAADFLARLEEPNHVLFVQIPKLLRALTMSSIESGILLIADISGYTRFLASSELEHAQDSLRSLLNLIIEHTRAPLVISRLEGDAVISYAPAGSFQQGQTIVEIIESTYYDFSRARELMMLNTTCTCNACRNIPNLDLKFFVHYGSFMLEPLHTYTELVGTDVNLVHRLTKNSVTQQTGLKAYVAYTQAAVDALGIDRIAETMIRHTDTYESIGEVQVYLDDLRSKWEQEKTRTRMSVQEEQAALTIEDDFPLPPLMMWDLVSSPQYKAILSGSKSARVDNLTNGRIGLGATFYCAHGSRVSPETIVDWQPPREYTWTSDPVFGIYMLNTVRLRLSEGGSHLAMLCGKPMGGRRLTRWLFMAIVGPIGLWGIKQNFRNLHRQIEIDLSEERLLKPTTRAVEGDEVLSAARQALTID